MEENYLAKWLNNELSEEELAQFKQTAEYASYQRIVAATEQMSAPDFNENATWDAIKATQDQAAPKVIGLNPFKPFLRVAAVIALFLGGAYFYLNSLNTTVTTQLAEQSQITLPDASEVVLNAASQISYSEKNWDKARSISLEGEAFFKVAKGKKFTVTTTAGTVAVLGTQFNVENRAGFFEVSCYEGLVSVQYQEKKQKLKAGQSFVVINGQIQERPPLQEQSPAWTNNESAFTSIPLKYVLAEFERQFNLKVATQNVDTDQLFTGSFDNTKIDLALESIATPSQIRYKLEADKVLFYAGNTP